MMNNAFAQKSMQVQILQPIPFDRNFPRVGEVWGKFLGIIYWIWMIIMLTMLVIPTKGLEKVHSPPPQKQNVMLAWHCWCYCIYCRLMWWCMFVPHGKILRQMDITVFVAVLFQSAFPCFSKKKSESPTIKTPAIATPLKTVMKPWRKTRESSFSQVEILFLPTVGGCAPLFAASIPSALRPFETTNSLIGGQWPWAYRTRSLGSQNGRGEVTTGLVGDGVGVGSFKS